MTAATDPGARRRRLRGAAVAVLALALTTTACSSLGRTAVGPVMYESAAKPATHAEADAHAEEGQQAEAAEEGGGHLAIAVTSPSVKGCHRLAGGANLVQNGTLIDMRLYENDDCKGAFTYLGTSLEDRVAPDARPWRSYSFVH
ncbi:hypothetical protein LG634_11135 [Streptomyces bambusae]|uniref:hypothetical protein n=1 Tax=Streptomyces bambusae TaxID=1550616 RepID=UPI001CFDC392|nr:hypothetical protein [Streptomyces bambusae]MCB5165382.1 hypothetical protein [Streptomyces bambusae]